MKQEHSFLRKDGRQLDEMRPVKVQCDLYGYAGASILLEIGSTKVLASVSLQTGVPQFLKGQRTGWLTAEYAMLPCSTRQRTNRDNSQAKANARSLEISRIIGRSFRSVVDLSLLPDKTIYIDCDVLQADGGTRVASITAASLALSVAVRRWVRDSIIQQNILRESIVAMSVGLVNGRVCLDLTQEEDNLATADWNFVVTRSGKLIEIQGTAEKEPISCEEFDALKALGLQGAAMVLMQGEEQLMQNQSIKKLFETVMSDVTPLKKEKSSSLFSIGARISN